MWDNVSNVLMDEHFIKDNVNTMLTTASLTSHLTKANAKYVKRAIKLTATVNVAFALTTATNAQSKSQVLPPSLHVTNVQMDTQLQMSITLETSRLCIEFVTSLYPSSAQTQSS